MQFKLALAIALSVVLIGVAAWFRFSHPAPQQEPEILAVEQPVERAEYEDQAFLSDFLKPKEEDAESVAKQLSTTELVGRQLILDYVGLAGNGPVSDEQVSALANRYASQVPTLLQAEKIEGQDLNTVSNSKANFTNYVRAFEQAYVELTNYINTDSVQVGNQTTFSEEHQEFAAIASTAYKNIAAKLQALAVPTALEDAHLRLINVYLSNAAAMDAVAKLDEDPTLAFSGVITLSTNVQLESNILSEMQNILVEEEII